MPVVIEEITGEITPPASPAQTQQPSASPAPDAVAEQTLRAVERAAWRRARLAPR